MTQTDEKTPVDIAIGAIGLWIPQSVGAAFLYAFNNAWFHRPYGPRGYITATLEALQGAILGIPSAYGQALTEAPFYTVLVGVGVLGVNALHQRSGEPRELMLFSMLVFVAIFIFLFYLRLG